VTQTRQKIIECSILCAVVAPYKAGCSWTGLKEVLYRMSFYISLGTWLQSITFRILHYLGFVFRPAFKIKIRRRRFWTWSFLQTKDWAKRLLNWVSYSKCLSPWLYKVLSLGSNWVGLYFFFFAWRRWPILSSNVCFNVYVKQGTIDRVQMANDVRRILFLSNYVNTYGPALQCWYIRMQSVGGMLSDSEVQITWK
jgi:hypothetical protein